MTSTTPLSVYARYASITTHVLLLAGLLLWIGWPMGLLVIAPMLAMLPGLATGRRRVYEIASLVLVFYVSGLLAEAYAIHSRHLIGLGLSVLAALEFVSVLLFARLSGRERAASAAQKAQSGAAAH